jgi:CspA family cold shock protein
MELIMVDDKVHYGIVEWFDPKRGIGFISWEIDGIKQKDMFLHFSDINCEGFKTTYKHQRVSFSVGTNVRGEPKAINCTILKN